MRKSFRRIPTLILTGSFFSGSVSAAAPPHLWSQRFGGTATENTAGVGVDGSSNLFVVGDFQGTVDFGGGPLVSSGGSDIFVAKYDAAGNHLWSQRFGSTGTDLAFGVAVDKVGNVIMTGHFYDTVDFGGGPLTSAGSSDIFVAKYDSFGNHIWSKSFGDVDNDVGLGVAADDSSNVLITGEFIDTVNFGGGALVGAGQFDIFVAKFDALGNHLWSKRFGDTSSDEGWDVATDVQGNSIVTGRFYNTVNFGGASLTSAGSSDIFVVKFGPVGNHLWSKRFGDADEERGNSVTVDSAGNVLVTGYFGGMVDFGGGPVTSEGSTDIFVVKFNSAGSHMWNQYFGDTGIDWGSDVAVDTADNVLLTGRFTGSVDFGGGLLAGGGAFNAFVAKLDATGIHLWSGAFGDLTFNGGSGVAADAANNVIASGHFEGTVNFGGGALTSAGSSDIFLAKFGSGPTGIGDQGPGISRRIVIDAYPNPFNPAITIRYGIPSAGPVTLRVYDIDGQFIKTVADDAWQASGQHVATWDGRAANGSAVASGIYFVRVQSGDRSQSHKMVLLK